MKEFTQKMPFIITFMSATLLLQMFAGEKVTYYFLMLVLLSMIVINYDEINDFLRRLPTNG